MTTELLQKINQNTDRFVEKVTAASFVGKVTAGLGPDDIGRQAIERAIERIVRHAYGCGFMDGYDLGTKNECD